MKSSPNYNTLVDSQNAGIDNHNTYVHDQNDNDQNDNQDTVIKNNSVCTEQINAILNEKKKEIAMALKVCARCTLCADSCFLYRSRERIPEYMPSHKFITSLGVIYKKKGKVTLDELLHMRDTLWKRCVLCTRCYCPLGINIPVLLALGRRILRSQGIYHLYSVPESISHD
ncbi:MAG: 4Fe-4S dicluster domain-containing protein [Desulfamplus sp.]|nr:4Fe-4S dicluster domain-containing protein [Desulfamplus sp.]